MRNKNIFVIENTEIGWHLALSIFLTNLLKHYKKSDAFSYSLICGKVEDIENIWPIQQIFDIYTTNTWLYSVKDNLLFSWRTLLNLIRFNKKARIDIIHAFYPNSSLLWAVIFKMFFSWKTRIIYDIRSPWIEMSFANNHISQKRDLIKWLMHLSEYILIRFVSEFVFITEWTRNYYLRKYKLKDTIRSTIIPSGVSVNEFQIPLSNEKRQGIQKEYHTQDWEVIIGYIWTISRMRKLDWFIQDNSKIIKDSNYRIIFIWDGDGFESLKISIQDSKIEDKVILLWKKSRKEIPQYIQSFDYWLCHLPDIFVFQNSFPLKILEYLSAWKRSLCTNIKAHKEIHKMFPEWIVLYENEIPKNLKVWEVDNWNNKVVNFDWNSLVNRYIAIYGNL